MMAAARVHTARISSTVRCLNSCATVGRHGGGRRAAGSGAGRCIGLGRRGRRALGRAWEHDLPARVAWARSCVAWARSCARPPSAHTAARTRAADGSTTRGVPCNLCRLQAWALSMMGFSAATIFKAWRGFVKQYGGSQQRIGRALWMRCSRSLAHAPMRRARTRAGRTSSPLTNIDAQGETLPHKWDSTSCRIAAARQKSKRMRWEWRAASLASSGATGQLKQTARSRRMRKRVARAPNEWTALQETAVRSSSSGGLQMAWKEVARTPALFCLPCLLL